MLLGVTSTALSVVVGPAGVARADLVTYEALAGADAVRDSIVSPDFPLSASVVDVGLPSAQAHVNGLGTSQAYAAFPYPGETPLSAPGLLSGETGVSLPTYPLIATSVDPTAPSGSLQRGPVTLTARSSPTSSSGSAVFAGTSTGADVGRLAAVATAAEDDATGRVSAQSSSDAALVDVAGVLHIGSVHATADAVRSADGHVTTASSLAITDVMVAGLAASITDQGVVLAGQRAPLPATGPPAELLSAAGISVTLLQPHRSGGDVVSGALVITQQQSQAGHRVTHTYTFGRAHASVFAVPEPGAAAAPTVRRPSQEGSGPRRSMVAATVAPTAGPGGVPVAEPSPAPTAAELPPLVASAGGAPTVALPARDASVVAFARLDSTYFYLLLVVVGLVALGGGQLLRKMAVRRSWI